jgi:hypothetical protein
VKPALAAALILLAACTSSTAGDCVDGLEGQVRCQSNAVALSWVEVCLDGDWAPFQACDVPGGTSCTTCVAEDAGGVAHACAPCPAGGNSVARCALVSPALVCP